MPGEELCWRTVQPHVLSEWRGEWMPGEELCWRTVQPHVLSEWRGNGCQVRSCAGAHGQVLASEPAAAFFLYPLPLAIRRKGTVRRQAIKSEEEGIQKEWTTKARERIEGERKRKRGRRKERDGEGDRARVEGRE